MAFVPLPTRDILTAIPEDMPARSMMLDMKEGPLVLMYRRLFRRLGIEPRGIIHLGGHFGEELLPYLLLGYERALFVEPDPRSFAKLQFNLQFVNALSEFADSFVGRVPRGWGHAVQVAVGDVNGSISLHVQPENTQENSILKPIVGSHAGVKAASEVLEVPLRTLDSLMEDLPEGWSPADFNVLYANVEGAELLALRGAEATLKRMDFVFSEVNLKSHYEGNPTPDDIERFLVPRGFELKWSCGGFLPDTGYMAFARRDAVATGASR